jgi:hypothetical protein
MGATRSTGTGRSHSRASSASVAFFPLAANAALFHPVGVAHRIHRPGVIARGHFAHELPGHRALHDPVLLEAPVALQLDFAAALAPHARPLHRQLLAAIDDVAALRSVPQCLLAAPSSAEALDFGIDPAAHEQQPQVATQRFGALNEPR